MLRKSTAEPDVRTNTVISQKCLPWAGVAEWQNARGVLVIPKSKLLYTDELSPSS